MAPIKLVILRDSLSYLMGEVTELDEEPSYLIAGCMKIDGDKVSANFKDGVLSIEIPKSVPEKPKRHSVKIG